MTDTQLAHQIIRLAEEFNAHLETGPEVATVTITFPAGDTNAYMRAEDQANEILRLIPQTRPGTVWGTDSGSVGGHAGLTGGYMRLSKSGIRKRLATAIRKQQERT